MRQHESKNRQNTCQISNGYRFIEISDLPLWEKRQAIRFIKTIRKSVSNVIYADKSTPMKRIKPILAYFKKNNEKNLYFALRKENLKDRVEICLKKIDLQISIADINEDLNVESWLALEK